MNVGPQLLYELDKQIFSLQNAMLSSPRSDPRHALYVQYLALKRCMRYMLSRQQVDLKEPTLGFTEAIYLPFPRGVIHPQPLNIVQIFYYLTLAIFFRAEESRQPQDVKCCIMYLRYLRGQGYEVPTDFPSTVPATLVNALAIQVKLDLGEVDVDQDIEDMADLCDELLDSGISINLLTSPIMTFCEAFDFIAYHKGHLEGRLISEKIVRCLRKANIRLPDWHGVSIAFAKCLFNRFNITPSDDDYTQGMVILDKIIGFRGPGDTLSPFRKTALMLAACFTQTQFNVHGKPEHLEEAISCTYAWLDRLSLDDPARPLIIGQLSTLQGLRFDGMDLRHILSGSLEFADFQHGAEYCRQLLASYSDSPLAPFARSALPNLLYHAFMHTDEIEYLNEAITDARDGMDIAHSLPFRTSSLDMLLLFLSIRLKLLCRREDLDELMHLFPIAANYEHPGLSRHSLYSCRWAHTARCFGHPSTPTAYGSAMSSLQSSLTFVPTLDKQHSRLVVMDLAFSTLPLEYASYQISTGRLSQAIETLERGRALLWSEMPGLRTSIDQIRLADSQLAEKFASVNKDLEALTLDFSPYNINIVGGGSNVLEEMDPYAHLVRRRQKFLDYRKELISQIQALPGLDTFLKSPSFDTLRFAACQGPVIIINHCEWRSDIVVFLHASPPSLISTSDDFYARANKLQGRLLGARKKGLGSDKYDEALRYVLKELYELVGRPVIRRLDELNVPEQSRIWWCPTSVFCSLPLHAMGPIPSDVGPPRYFMDLYIPSYTPSLSALIDSRKPGPQTFNKPSMLLVLQPDAFMVQALEEMQAVQAVNPQVNTLIGATATPAGVLERLRDHRFAHIVCHGLLEPGRPFDSSFKPYEGKRLSLLDVVRSRLPNAEFAFLAACHTAELTDESPADEALHLTAAMQYRGFRSIVGTMWAMADTDGRDLARNFYKSVFSGRRQGIHYYERTAEALRDAVVKMRRKRGRRMTLERWVNYVHYGA